VFTISSIFCLFPARGATYLIEKREPPGHIWSVMVKDITSTKHEITGLEKDRDYMFRIRAKNEFGTSEPTLPLTLYRDRGGWGKT